MKHIYFSLFVCFLFANTIYAQPSYVPTNGLIAWWGFDGNSQDQSSNSNHLTASSTAPVLTADRFNNTNSAYQFNGTNSYFTKSTINNTFTQSSNFSVSIWIKKESSTSGVAIMSGSTSSNNFVWNIQSSTTVSMFGTNKQGSSWFWVNGPNYTVNQWEHFVGVYNNGSMSFYKNGVLVGTNSNTHNASATSMPIWIGRGAGGGYMSGSADDIGIWNRVLTQSEITQLYQSTLNTDTFSLQSAKVYPNPSSNEINITFTEEHIGETFEIYDELGRRVYSNTILEIDYKMNISDFAKGIYLLKISGDLSTVKFIKS